MIKTTYAMQDISLILGLSVDYVITIEVDMKQWLQLLLGYSIFVLCMVKVSEHR